MLILQLLQSHLKHLALSVNTDDSQDDRIHDAKLKDEELTKKLLQDDVENDDSDPLELMH